MPHANLALINDHMKLELKNTDKHTIAKVLWLIDFEKLISENVMLSTNGYRYFMYLQSLQICANNCT